MKLFMGEVFEPLIFVTY